MLHHNCRDCRLPVVKNEKVKRTHTHTAQDVVDTCECARCTKQASEKGRSVSQQHGKTTDWVCNSKTTGLRQIGLGFRGYKIESRRDKELPVALGNVAMRMRWLRWAPVDGRILQTVHVCGRISLAFHCSCGCVLLSWAAMAEESPRVNSQCVVEVRGRDNRM